MPNTCQPVLFWHCFKFQIALGFNSLTWAWHSSAHVYKHFDFFNLYANNLPTCKCYTKNRNWRQNKPSIVGILNNNLLIHNLSKIYAVVPYFNIWISVWIHTSYNPDTVTSSFTQQTPFSTTIWSWPILFFQFQSWKIRQYTRLTALVPLLSL